MHPETKATLLFMGNRQSYAWTYIVFSCRGENCQEKEAPLAD
jgi:hypothetical protein